MAWSRGRTDAPRSHRRGPDGTADRRRRADPPMPARTHPPERLWDPGRSCGSLGGWCLTWVERFAGLEHANEAGKPTLPSVGSLGIMQPIENRVAILAIQFAKARRARGCSNSAAWRSWGTSIVRGD